MAFGCLSMMKPYQGPSAHIFMSVSCNFTGCVGVLLAKFLERVPGKLFYLMFFKDFMTRTANTEKQKFQNLSSHQIFDESDAKTRLVLIDKQNIVKKSSL